MEHVKEKNQLSGITITFVFIEQDGQTDFSFQLSLQHPQVHVPHPVVPFEREVMVLFTVESETRGRKLCLK